MITVGIPRALLYYEYFPMWQAFFTELGAEIIVSPPTTQAMLNEGSNRVVAETCLPAKVFLGHAISLAGKCDYIFIPAVRSVKKRAYNCSKLLGLPDMSKAVIPELPGVLEIEVDINRGKRRFYESIYELGRTFTWNPLRTRKAALAAGQAHRDYKVKMRAESKTPPEAIANKREPVAIVKGREPLTVAVIGHPYLLYDEHINHRLISRIRQAGNRVLTPEMVEDNALEEAARRMVAGDAQWNYDYEVIGAGSYYLENEVDGIIGIMNFGCGPDSLLMDMIHRQSARLQKTPFMGLTIEEHTAEAGIITRLEAFLDMIERRKKRRQAVCV